MRNLWLLLLVGLWAGFFGSKSYVSCQTSAAADDIYIEGQSSGDLPIDDEDGEDDGSGSGSGDYAFNDYREEIFKRILNISTSLAKEMPPFQPPPTTPPYVSLTTEAESNSETTESVTDFYSETITSQTDIADITSSAPSPVATSEIPAVDTRKITEKNREIMDEIILRKVEDNYLGMSNNPLEVTSENLWERTEVLAAVIACGVVGFLCAVFLLLLLAYRMKKKDEGSYDLGNTKLSATGYHKAPTKEFYA